MTSDNIINLTFGLLMAVFAIVGIWQARRLSILTAVPNDVEMQTASADGADQALASRASTLSSVSS